MPKFKELKKSSSVLSAMAEYDQIGQEAFLKRYGFGKALRFILLHEGRKYDSKAIVGAAYGYEYGQPLKRSEFSGGKNGAAQILKNLQFKVIEVGVEGSTIDTSENHPSLPWEGKATEKKVKAYERSLEARARCIEEHGTTCAICTFNFSLAYGEEFQGFIHVHHKVPLSDIGERYQVNPKTDLIPLCPNCHAAIHHGNKTRSVESIREMLSRNGACHSS